MARILATWLLDGQRPLSVFAITQRIKPDIYPNVEDDATIIVTYPKAQAIFQASWNWPYNRKDMEIYGRDGYVLVPNSQNSDCPAERAGGRKAPQSPGVDRRGGRPGFLPGGGRETGDQTRRALLASGEHDRGRDSRCGP
jgi:predicted dehydrogenase